MRITVKPPKGDATAAIQAAIDKIALCDKHGRPNTGAVTHQKDRANGGTVYLPAGTYPFTKPLRLYGMVNLAGDGRDTFLNFPDSDAIDLVGVDLGGQGDLSNVWAGVRDVAIRCGGDAFSSSTGGVLAPRIERVQATCGGWLVNLPFLPKHQCYAQDAIIRDCHHIDPGAGSILLRGNVNLIEGNYVSNGARPDFRSPWEEAGLAMVDVGGIGNTIVRNHVEFSCPKDVGVLPYAFRGRADGKEWWGKNYALMNYHEVTLESRLKVGFSVLIDNCVTDGGFYEDFEGYVKCVNGGRRV